MQNFKGIIYSISFRNGQRSKNRVYVQGRVLAGRKRTSSGHWVHMLLEFLFYDVRLREYLCGSVYFLHMVRDGLNGKVGKNVISRHWREFEISLA